MRVGGHTFHAFVAGDQSSGEIPIFTYYEAEQTFLLKPILSLKVSFSLFFLHSGKLSASPPRK
jgi:hypothetical protein